MTMSVFEVLIGFMICCYSVNGSSLHYIYDDKVGFLGLENNIGAVAYAPGYNTKKQVAMAAVLPRYQKYNNGHLVDSHFKIIKTPSRYTIPTLMDRNNVLRVNDFRNYLTEVPSQTLQANHARLRSPLNQQQPTEQHSMQKTINSAKTMIVKPGNMIPLKNSYNVDSRISQQQSAHKQKEINKKVEKTTPSRPKAVNVDYNNALKPIQRVQNKKFESKPNFVPLNMRQNPVQQEAQKIARLSHNHLPAAGSSAGHSVQNRVPLAMIVEKKLHNPKGLNEHNMQLMARVLDDLTQQQITDIHQKKAEYRKRDTHTMLDHYNKPKRNSISEKMRKYINGKDRNTIKDLGDKKNMLVKQSMDKIVGSEKKAEYADDRYALFYRMNPTTLKQKDAFIFVNSVETNAANDNNKQSPVEKTDVKKSTPLRKTRAGNVKRIHKKMKNFSNFLN